MNRCRRTKPAVVLINYEEVGSAIACKVVVAYQKSWNIMNAAKV